MKRITVILTAMLVAFMMGGAWSWAEEAPEKKVHKSYVCKYVGTPGVDERLQTGQNPIWVANQSLTGEKGSVVEVGQEFSDKHGKSVVIVANTVKLDPEPDVSQCPAPEPGKATLWFEFLNPTCETDAYIDSEFDPTKINGEVVDGVVGPGETVTVVYSPKPGYVIDHPDVNDEGNVVVTFTFDEVPDNCATPEERYLTQEKVNCDGVFERKVTLTVLEGEVIDREVGEWKFVRDLTADEKAELECKVPVDKPEPPKDEPKPDKPEKPVEELAATGGNLTYAGVAAALLATGSAMLWFGRRRLTDF